MSRGREERIEHKALALFAQWQNTGQATLRGAGTERDRILERFRELIAGDMQTRYESADD